MIKPEELKKGNLIHVPSTGQTIPVTVINMDLGVWVNRSLGVLGFDQIDPTPLTEEWLLKMGFNKDYQKGYIGIGIGNSDFVLTEPLKMGEWQTSYAFQFTAGNVPKFKKIEYVHHLQNLFFALCGEELKIKQ